MVTRAVLLLVIALAAVPGTWAGCRKQRKVVPESERFYNHQPVEQLGLEQLPQQFSWRNKDGQNWLAPSWNQHLPVYCGSCFLHATLSMIQDRLKIAKNATGPDVMLARQTFLNCAPFHGYSEGCNGGDVIDVVRYMTRYGLPDESCMTYSATDHTKYSKHAKECPAIGYCMNCMPLKGKDTCWAVKTPIRYYLSAYGNLDQPGELAMMNEIYARGPITCSMATADLFDYGYQGGVYEDKSNSTDVDHDIEVVGWGVDASGTKGELGFFKLKRGVNNFQIESGDCWYAIPSWKDEENIRSGAYVGTMWGIFSKEEAAKIKPEGHKRPHFIDEDEEDEDRKPRSSGGAKLPLKRAQQLVLGRDRA